MVSGSKLYRWGEIDRQTTLTIITPTECLEAQHLLTSFDLWAFNSDEKEEEDYEKEEVGEDGEIILVSGDKVSGPWNKSSSVPAPAAPVGE